MLRSASAARRSSLPAIVALPASSGETVGAGKVSTACAPRAGLAAASRARSTLCSNSALPAACSAAASAAFAAACSSRRRSRAAFASRSSAEAVSGALGSLTGAASASVGASRPPGGRSGRLASVGNPREVADGLADHRAPGRNGARARGRGPGCSLTPTGRRRDRPVPPHGSIRGRIGGAERQQQLRAVRSVLDGVCRGHGLPARLSSAAAASRQRSALKGRSPMLPGSPSALRDGALTSRRRVQPNVRRGVAVRAPPSARRRWPRGQWCRVPRRSGRKVRPGARQSARQAPRKRAPVSDSPLTLRRRLRGA